MRNGDKLEYISGDHLVISDYSGQKFLRSECRYTWDNLLVGKDEWDPKQPQLTIDVPVERIAVDDTRTQKPDGPLLDPPITDSQLL